MAKKAYVVTGLGLGDDAKGSVVHAIATKMSAHTIVKVGGGQGSHGVRTAAGESFPFKQWSCGTFEGIKTHISDRLIVLPEGLLNESDQLRYQHGIHDPFTLLTVDERSLCATPYHGILSRIKERARGNDRRGTVGTGVGEAYQYSQRFPQLTIRVADLVRPDIKDLLAAVRERVEADLEPVMQGEFLPDDRSVVDRMADLLCQDRFLDYVAQRFWEAGRRTRIVGHEYLSREILSRDGAIVVERSHGVLGDHYCGFHPHTSSIRTLPCGAHAMLEEAGYSGKIVDIGVTRAYAFSHGPRPMPTADPKMAENFFPGSQKEESRYRGKIRAGPLDLVLLRYAIECCGGADAFDGLAVTCFDQVTKSGKWAICKRYGNADNPEYFTPDGAIKVRQGTDDEQLAHQEGLGKQLQCCKPEITTLDVPSGIGQDRDKIFSFCADTLQELGVPVRLVSVGPTEKDKIFR